MAEKRLVRIRRGARPLEIQLMKTSEEFNAAWERRMLILSHVKYDTGLWGMLNRDEMYLKLCEVSKSQDANALNNYRAWYDHLFNY